MDSLLDFFIPAAYAQSTAIPPPQGGGISFILLFVIFFLFIYFAIWRPQNKRAKEQQNLLGSLSKGDEVVTAGGLLGRIEKINDQYITLIIANNVGILMQKSSVVSVMPKGTIKTLE